MNFDALWLFWLGCTIGSVAYGLWRGDLSGAAGASYWIAFTILAIQFLGVGQK